MRIILSIVRMIIVIFTIIPMIVRMIPVTTRKTPMVMARQACHRHPVVILQSSEHWVKWNLCQ